MPRVSAFYGVVITMNYKEHPPAHFHAVYAESKATIEIATLKVLRGGLPPRATRLVRNWAAIHQPQLADNWERARAHLPLATIEPLP